MSGSSAGTKALHSIPASSRQSRQYSKLAATPLAAQSIRASTTAAQPWTPTSHHTPRIPCIQLPTRRYTSHQAASFPTDANPARTALYSIHARHGAHFIPFGGYEMPVHYTGLSVGASHRWTRTHSSLFDVGHMAQYHVSGRGAEAFLQQVTPAALADLPPGQATLSALLWPSGGMVDDCMLTRLRAGDAAGGGGGHGQQFYLVANAGCRAKDYAFLHAALRAWNAEPAHGALQAALTLLVDQGLIALQGPLAAAMLAPLIASPPHLDMHTWYFGHTRSVSLRLPSGTTPPLLVSRGGYTGEDGFELSIPASHVASITAHLLAQNASTLRLGGLGARDSLRLEAGLCLYGHDLTDSTTPVAASLAWLVPKTRRSAAAATFNGAATILDQLTPVSQGGAGVAERRVGLIVSGAPAREGAAIVGADGAGIGRVTSGCPSPTLGRNIAMGYVKTGMHAVGTEVGVVVRGKTRGAVVAKMPFVPSKYFRPAAAASLG